MKYLCFGSVNIDKCYAVEHIVLPGETLSSVKKTVQAGGKGGNQAGALAKAGLPVYLAARLGQDGRFVLEQLQEFGVNTQYADISSPFSGEAIIQVTKEGQNSIILSSGGNGEITKEYVDSVLSHFSVGDAIILQNEINENKYIIAEAKKKDMFVIFNPSPFNDRISLHDLEDANMIFINEVEAAQIVGKEPGAASYDELLKSLGSLLPTTELILTVGKDGAYYQYGGNYVFAPIVDAPVVDTTAAGDTFLGYFLAARDRGFSPGKALEIASLASSITVSRMGALPSIPVEGMVFASL